MFVALLINATYVQYWQADDLTSLSQHPDNKRVRDAEFSRERGGILVRGKAVAESNKSDDVYKLQRVYPQGPMYAHLTGYFSRDFGPRRRRVDPELHPVRQRLPAVHRQPGHRPGRRRRPQGRQRHPDGRPRRAEGGVRRAPGARQQRARCRRRHRAPHRQDPRDGLQPDLQPQPVGQPRLHGGRAAPRSASSQRQAQPAGQHAPSRRSCPRARRSSWSPRQRRSTRASTPPRRSVPGGSTPRPAPDHHRPRQREPRRVRRRTRSR